MIAIILLVRLFGLGFRGWSRDWCIVGVGWLSGLMAGISGVELCKDGGGDPLEHLLGEDTEKLPSDVQGLEHSAVLVVTLN